MLNNTVRRRLSFGVTLLLLIATLCTGFTVVNQSNVAYAATSSTNLALGATATASSSVEEWVWHLANINDGQVDSTVSNYGWTSAQSSANSTEWVQLDLGANQTFNKMKLFPRNDPGNGGYGFPLDFKVEVSTNGTNWTQVVQKTDYPFPNPVVGQEFVFDNVTDRYVRVTGTKLRTDKNGTYYMQFAEIEVWSVVVPPTLTAVKTDNDTTHDIEITFTDDLAWRTAITAIKDGTISLTAGTDYEISAGKLTVKAGVLATGNHMITVKATGFTDALSNTFSITNKLPATVETNTNVTSITSSSATAGGNVTSSGGGTVTERGVAYSVYANPVSSNGKAAAASGGTGAFSVNLTGLQSATTYHLRAYAVSEFGTSYGQDATLTTLSSDSSLKALSLSGIALDQTVSADVYTYTASVPNHVSNLTVTGRADSTARLAVNGDRVENDQPSSTINLKVGRNTITVTITAQDGTKRDYTITVARAANNDATLSSLTIDQGELSPDFTSLNTNYTVNVPNSVSKLTASFATTNSNATFSVTGAVYSSVTGNVYAYNASNLVVGSNSIRMIVTAEDGTTKPYTLTVNRAQATPGPGGGDGGETPTLPANNANLSGLKLSSGTLTPEFASATTDYTASVDNDVSSITVTANVYDSKATVQVNGTAIAKGQASNAINLKVGSNKITVTVRAQDGTKKDYTITVTRAANNDATLSSLTIDQGELSPAFSSLNTDYTVSVPKSVSSLNVSLATTYSQAAFTVTGANDSSVTGNVYAYNVSNLVMGSNPIRILVTAESGATQLYTLTVTRASSSSSSTTSISNTVVSTNGNLTLPTGKKGEVSLDDEIKITIPDDAFVKELRVTIEKITDIQKLLTNKGILVSPIFEILKNFTENFSKPVTMIFTFDPNSLKNDQKPSVFYYDEAKKVWVEIGGKVDGNHITVEVDHFTKFAVFAVGQDQDTITDANLKLLNFSDISGHWAETNIKQAVSAGIVSGYPDDTFKPDRTVTRAEFAVMLMNGLKLPDKGAVLTFIDTEKIGSWAQKAVAQSAQAGIVSGYEDGTFRPDAEITRQEMAVMIARTLGLSIQTSTTTGFADDKDIPEWAKGAVGAMRKLGVIEGKGANAFAPNDKTTRAEAVTVLLKMFAYKG
ncbi:cadherin-like beta sandwich domain-containing protein [Paenibacillus sp. WQ 127069]|uniref:Cadherin-like beta sandwich domain-containing protein n=1 Tax=Paenibacillus baimaensis TaxID=2982185 RepID=A0ABT2UL85_9BACL|nr:cadherin-like beta sandwich domain-containing protein [Paenibacillus sp. WQ 127069]MCU6794424.1 cadherin-like beta sandwich domain-containing protein [Paenibacillus sp. WQ 127069]